jgi:hypothetical protein
MARRIPLRTVRIAVANGTDNAAFAYSDMMKTILTFGSPQKGLVLDEVLKAIDATGALDKAVAEGADHVVFTEEQYRTLREKLESFPFALADTSIAEFGLAIRNAPEIT